MASTNPHAQMPQITALPDIMPNPEGGAPGLTLAAISGKTLINLRASDKIKASLDTLFGTALPTQPNRLSIIGASRAMWLGPDETLLMIDEARQAEFMLKLGATLKDTHYAATIITDAIRILRLGGARRLDVLAKGCGLDLHPAIFAKGHCAQSLLSHASVTLARDAEDSLLLFCRTSFSDYVTSWLKDAAIEYGYRLDTSPAPHR